AGQPRRAGGGLPPRFGPGEPGLYRRHHGERRALAGVEPDSQSQVPDHRDCAVRPRERAGGGVEAPVPEHARPRAREAEIDAAGFHHASQAARIRADHAGGRRPREGAAPADAADESGFRVLTYIANKVRGLPLTLPCIRAPAAWIWTGAQGERDGGTGAK